jgi:hypothetical protein
MEVAPQYQAPQAPQGMAGGGIIAFQKGEKVTDPVAEKPEEATSTAGNIARSIGSFFNEQQQKSLEAQQRNQVGNQIRQDIRAAQPGFFEALTPSQRAQREQQVKALEALKAGPPVTNTGGATGRFDDAPVAAPAAPAAAPASIKAVPRPAAPAAPAAAPAVASAPTQAGIVAAAPKFDQAGEAEAQAIMAAAPAVGGTGSTMPATGIQAAAEAAQKEANLPDSEFLKRVKAGQPENTAAAEFRKQTMDERANSKAENERQRQMRLAQFFAKWGSTPGPTLAAGLSALEKSLPDMIADEAGFKKAKRELDKVMFDIDNATRLEELGNTKEARALKEKAADRAMTLNNYLTQQQTSAASDASRERSSKYTADQQRISEEIRSAQAAADRAQRRGEAGEAKKYQDYTTVAKNEEIVLARIASERSDKDYQKLQQQASMPDTVTGPAKKQRDEAIAKMQVIEEGWATRKKDAATRTEAAKIRATGEATPAPTGMSAADKKAAEQWLKANPNDPRAANIRQQLGR